MSEFRSLKSAFDEVATGASTDDLPTVMDISTNSINHDFDTDDEEEQFDLSPLHIDWIDGRPYELPQSFLAVSALPGCRFKNVWRKLDQDINTIKQMGITNVLDFCTNGDHFKFRTENLDEAFAAAALEYKRFAHEDGSVPPMKMLMEILDQLKVNMSSGFKTLIFCHGGLGRSCLVATCFLMLHSPALTADAAIEYIRSIRGHAAIQSVKQFNFIQEFRGELEKWYLVMQKDERERAISR